jgi:ankyrin repeat protein
LWCVFVYLHSIRKGIFPESFFNYFSKLEKMKFSPSFAITSIREEYDCVTPLIGSIEKGSTECFNILIETPGIDLDGRGFLLKTPLLVAIKAKRYEMAFKLLEKNVDINAQDAYGYTPIVLAILNSHVPLIKALLNAGANLNCKNDWKENLWHLATRSDKCAEICPLLIEGGIQC